MTLELAKYSELVARDESRIELRIAQTHQQLLDGPYQERLRAALEKHFGARLRLVVKVADHAGGSPAAIAGREQQRQHALAAAAIEQDPFVRELLENFDGRVVDSSIKPVQ
jgi:DNA polymerase-3 subunit gamma/tau